MTGAKFNKAIQRFRRGEAGASLIEYAIVFSVFLLIFFAILDFGRLGFNWVMTEKAMQRAARIAIVRPPVCANVPDSFDLATGSGADLGTLCRSGACAAVPARTCLLGNVDRATATPLVGQNNSARTDCATMDLTGMGPTAVEIWRTICPILPVLSLIHI